MIRRSLEVARDHTGAVLVEFTILAPVLVLMLLGVLQFGLLYYYRISVTTATVVGARMLSISRRTTPPSPYSDTVAAIQNSSSNLNASNLTITLATYNGTAWVTCNTDTSCYTQLANAYNPPPQPASVTVSYPCPILIPTSWVNLSGICPMTSTVKVRVQ